MYCSEGSYAEKFAIDNDIPYVVLKDIKISFDANGGSNAPSELIGTVTDAITVPSMKPIKTGSTFIGWADTSTATEAKYMIGDKVMYNGKAYASTVDNNVWAPDVYGWEEV